MLTAATIKRELLEPGMDARSLNLDEARLLHNPDTAEIDSLAEAVLALKDPRLVRLTRGIVELNTREGLREMIFTGAADRLVTDLRRLELNEGGARGALAAKGIARKLREPLRALADSDTGHLVDAFSSIAELLRAVPRAQLLAPAVRHELGERKFTLLRDLVTRAS